MPFEILICFGTSNDYMTLWECFDDVYAFESWFLILQTFSIDAYAKLWGILGKAQNFAMFAAINGLNKLI